MKHTRSHLPQAEDRRIRRLVWANVIAALALVLTVVITLWALGLLDSIWTFIF